MILASRACNLLWISANLKSISSKSILLILTLIGLSANAKYWSEDFLYYYIDPDILAIEPRVEDDLREVMNVPMSKTLVRTSKRIGADIRILANDGINTVGKTNFYLKNEDPEQISTAVGWVNLEKMNMFLEENYPNALRNTVRHEFLHCLLCQHDKAKPRGLMHPNLSTDKIYWTKRDRKQLRTLYPI